jgi:hypothetical protein
MLATFLGEAFILAVVVFAFSVPVLLTRLRWRLNGPIDNRLRGTVRAYGLSATRGLLGDTAEGRIDGFKVHIRYIDTQQKPRQKDQPWGPATARCRVSIALNTPLPAGIRLSSMSITQTVLQGLGAQDIQVNDSWIDPALRIRADQPELARRLLTSPAVITALRRTVTHTADSLEVTPEEVSLTRGGINVPDAGAVLDIALELARTLQEASRVFWQDLATTLELSDAVATSHGATLSGERRGVPLTVRFITDEEGDCHTRIEARFHRTLPGGLRLQPRRPGGGSTGNPILDMKLSMSATDPQTARRLLADPALTGPLMELLDHPGEARILPDGVRLSLPGWSSESLHDLLDAASEVAVILGDTPAPTRPPQGLTTTE